VEYTIAYLLLLSLTIVLTIYNGKIKLIVFSSHISNQLGSKLYGSLHCCLPPCASEKLPQRIKTYMKIQENRKQDKTRQNNTKIERKKSSAKIQN